MIVVAQSAIGLACHIVVGNACVAQRMVSFMLCLAICFAADHRVGGIQSQFTLLHEQRAFSLPLGIAALIPGALQLTGHLMRPDIVFGHNIDGHAAHMIFGGCGCHDLSPGEHLGRHGFETFFHLTGIQCCDFAVDDERH